MLCTYRPATADPAGAPAGAPAPLAGVCVDCHPLAASPHVASWFSSRHRRADVGCVNCHRADSSSPSADGLHDASDPTRGGREAVEELCGDCHPEVLRLYAHSPVGRPGHAAGTPTCLSCHSAEGSQLLGEREVALRCAECHKAGSAAGHTEIPGRARVLLDDLRRLSLTRVLVREAVLAEEARGKDMTWARKRLLAVDRIAGDPVLEWHRFDLVRVDQSTRRAIQVLSSLHADLGAP